MSLIYWYLRDSESPRRAFLPQESNLCVSWGLTVYEIHIDQTHSQGGVR